jgi:hypothetical protein
MEVIPDAPDDVREAARFAFWEVQMPRDDARGVARARERIRNIKSPRGVAGLKPEVGGGLWEGRELYERDFARLSFEEKKQKFMSDRAGDMVAWQGIPAQPGAPGDAAFHAAGILLLAWWEEQGRKVTANRGYGDTRAGNREQRPCETVRFLGNEFLLIADWYGNSEWATPNPPGEEYSNPEAGRLLLWSRDKALNVGFKVAQSHVRNRTAFR